MKVSNADQPGERGFVVTRGLQTPRRGGRLTTKDSSGTVIVQPTGTLVFDVASFNVIDIDDETALIAAASSTVLAPDALITATKDPDNPTFDGDFIPENIIKVGSTYYCIGQTWALGVDEVHLWTATDPAGPWTVYGSNPIYEISDVPWPLGTANSIYAPEFVEDSGTFYLFYSVVGPAGQDGKIGLATATVITGPYTDHGSAIVSEGAPSSVTSLRVGEASVIHFAGQWVMAAMAEDEDIAFGSSERVYIYTAPLPTGPWTIGNGGAAIIDHGANGEWDDDLIADPFLFTIGSRYWILYSGGGSVGGTGTRKWHLGLAYADDPEGPWTKYDGNPILEASASGWDEMAAWRGSLFQEGGVFYGVYGGLNADLSVAKGGNFSLDVASVAEFPVASDIAITDAGGYYTGTEVEAALQEIGAALAVAAGGAGGHYEVIVSGTAPPVAVTNIAEDDWLYGFVAD